MIPRGPAYLLLLLENQDFIPLPGQVDGGIIPERLAPTIVRFATALFASVPAS